LQRQHFHRHTRSDYGSFSEAMMTLKPVDKNLFFSRHDPKDPRLGEIAKSSAEDGGISIFGYPDDEGVKRNGGRLGAGGGPTAIRHWLYRMTPHPTQSPPDFCDHGDLHWPKETTLEERHMAARQCVEDALKKGHKALCLGGGNDYASADGLAFLNCAGDKYKPLVINVDAHLDVRDFKDGVHSGTPFRQLLESGSEFDFVELGIQSHCNARDHWEYVKQKGGKILSMEAYWDSGLSLLDFTIRELGQWLLRPRPTYLAIDMDAFAWPFAAGTSAALPLGLMPQDFMPLYRLFLQRLDVRVLGLYETAPELEAGPGTSKLAAQLAHAYLSHV